MSFDKECAVTMMIISAMLLYCCGHLLYKAEKLKDDVQALEKQIRKLEEQIDVALPSPVL